jgi:hypothetical protein
MLASDARREGRLSVTKGEANTSNVLFTVVEFANGYGKAGGF